MINKKRLSSLRVKLFLVMCIALCVGTLSFVILHTGIDWMISKKYMSNEAIVMRNNGYIESLQDYVTINNISSKDTAKISLWVKSKRYVYLFLYKDNKLFWESGNDDEYDSSIKPDISIIINNSNSAMNGDGLYPLKLSDGIIFASISEQTEDLFYNISYIISIFAAFVVFAIIMLTYFNKTTTRIQYLAKRVRLVEQNKDILDIKDDVGDEISDLIDDVNKMRNSILEKVKEERAAYQANTQLITAMSHDIRNPLTVLLGYLDIIGMQKDISEQSRDYIAQCKETAMKIKTLSDDMFQYFLVFGKKDIDMSMQEYDADELLKQMLSEHTILMQESGYNFVVENSIDRKCTVIIDTQAFERVMDNVFSNLRKYADIAEPIYISLELSDNKLRIRIENKVVHNDTESNGIGLKTCAKIMEALKGDFVIQNDNANRNFALIITLLLKGN